MTAEPSGTFPEAAPDAPDAPDADARRGRFWLLRGEDVVLAVWIAFAAPLLVTQGSFQLFETGRPLDGVLMLASVAAALLCLVSHPATESGDWAPLGAWIGPLTGGALLVTMTGFSALDAPDGWTAPIAIAGLVGIGIVRLAVGTLSASIRRALVTPLVLVSGSLFWSVIDAVIGPSGTSTISAQELRDALANNTPGAGLFALALLAFTAVYYAMLVYAPRQVADKEGSPLAWLARYALFVASILFGLGWINALGL
jgi:hypothetical protein